MSWHQFRPYVSVAKRRQQAAMTAKKMAKQGQALSPVQPEGRAIATTFWGLAWCTNLESYSDYSNRLPRGRTYLRNGSVIDLQIAPALITGLVQGSSLYKIRIQIESLPGSRWKSFCADSAGKVTSLLDLLQGRLSKGVLEAIARPADGLFPTSKQIKMSCSCPDSAGLCKHLAAVLYGVGTRLDEKPELFFTLRSVDMKDLISAATASATQSSAIQRGNRSLEGEDLSALFGVDVESSAVDVPARKSDPKLRKKPKRPVKSLKAAAAEPMPVPIVPVKKASAPRKFRATASAAKKRSSK